MPTYKGLLRDAEIRGLVAYIKSLNPRFKAEAERENVKPPDGDAADGAASSEGQAPPGGTGDAAAQPDPAR